MFRIFQIDSPRERYLIVEGNLSSLWSLELRQAWMEARKDLGGRRIVIDVSEVTNITPEGEELLLELACSGVKLLGCAQYFETWASELRSYTEQEWPSCGAPFDRPTWSEEGIR